MDLRRFRELYIAEAQDHLRLLQRSLLALEQDRSGSALDEAFRAAHTLKGISAAMGYSEVAGAAHHLEDRLAGLRSGPAVGLGAAVDDLLERADTLAAAIEAAISDTPPPQQSGASSGAADAQPPRRAATVLRAMPAGTAVIVHVRLRPDTPLGAARAILIMKALEGRRGLIGSEPAEFTDAFAGELFVFFGANADLDGVEPTIRSAGDVDTVDVSPARPAPAGDAAATAAAAPAVSSSSPEQADGPSAQVAGASAGESSAASAGASVGAPTAGRTPGLRHVRVEAGRLDDLAEGIGEVSALVSALRLDRTLKTEAADTVDRVAVLLGTLQQDVMQLRMVPLREAFERLPRVVRDAARAVGKEVELATSGEDVQLDRAIVEEIAEPLVHLLRNAVDHGIESAPRRAAAGKRVRGLVEVRALRERSSVRIVVADDGGGVAAARVIERARDAGMRIPGDGAALAPDQLLTLLSQPGLSTAVEVSAVSGRGVGLDVVLSRIRALGGAVDMQTTPGEGTTFSIRLPVTLAMAPALRVRVGGEQYFIPLTHVSEAMDLQGAIGADETVEVRGERIPLVRLGPVLGAEGGTSADTAIIAGVGDRRVALGIDELVAREQVLVKSFVAVPGMLPHFVGVAFLAAGRPALVLDPLSLIGGQ